MTEAHGTDAAVMAPRDEARSRSSEMLQLRGVKKSYGSFVAVKGLDLDVHRG